MSKAPKLPSYYEVMNNMNKTTTKKVVQKEEIKKDNRFRNHVISFRVSADEKKQIDNAIKHAKQPKAQFMIDAILNIPIQLIATEKVILELRKELSQIKEILNTKENSQDINHERLEILINLISQANYQ